MELYANGKKESQSEEQSGDLLYPDAAPYVMALIRTPMSFIPTMGEFVEVQVFGEAAKAEWVAKEFAHNESLATEKWNEAEPSFQVLVEPYLQFATQPP